MTGYRSRHFRYSCAKGCYIEQLPDWDDLIPCFPRKIRPTDIDGMVEINNRFLFLEEKRAGVGPDDGQRLALRRLSQRDGFTTMLFRPKLAAPSILQCMVFNQHEPAGWVDRSREWLQDWLRVWADAADNGRDFPMTEGSAA